MSAFQQMDLRRSAGFLGGPIGGIPASPWARSPKNPARPTAMSLQRMLPNDFSAALLVLCAAVMKADQKVMRSELESSSGSSLRDQSGEQITQDRMLLFRRSQNRDIAIHRRRLRTGTPDGGPALPPATAALLRSAPRPTDKSPSRSSHRAGNRSPNLSRHRRKRF